MDNWRTVVTSSPQWKENPLYLMYHKFISILKSVNHARPRTSPSKVIWYKANKALRFQEIVVDLHESNEGIPMLKQHVSFKGTGCRYHGKTKKGGSFSSLSQVRRFPTQVLVKSRRMSYVSRYRHAQHSLDNPIKMSHTYTANTIQNKNVTELWWLMTCTPISLLSD